jgi:uncharacterized membrane protein
MASLFRWHKPAGPFHLGGSLLYLVGAILVTTAFNVPLNEALATVDPTNPESTNLWAGFFSSWMVWNHVRTLGAFVAAASLTVALYRPRLRERALTAKSSRVSDSRSAGLAKESSA